MEGKSANCTQLTDKRQKIKEVNSKSGTNVLVNNRKQRETKKHENKNKNHE